MNHSFENQVALVTGAASGIGLATARAFSEAGAAVALIEMDENAAGARSSNCSWPGASPKIALPAPTRNILRDQMLNDNPTIETAVAVIGGGLAGLYAGKLLRSIG